MANELFRYVLFFTLAQACSPAGMIPPPEINPLPQVDTQAQEARQHILTASYMQTKGELTLMDYHLEQAWLRSQDPAIWILWGDLLMQSDQDAQAVEKWKEGLEQIPPSKGEARQTLWRRINSSPETSKQNKTTQPQTDLKEPK